MKSSDQIREFAGKRFVEPARQSEGAIVSIRSGDIVKGMRLKNKTPNVCTALRSKKFQDEYGLQLIGEQGPPSGMSTTVVFTYKFTDQGATGAIHSGLPSSFERLRGIANGMLPNPGDWERSIQSDRRNFYGKDDNEKKRKLG